MNEIPVRWMTKVDNFKSTDLPKEARRVAVDEDDRVYVFASSSLILEVLQSGKDARFVAHDDGSLYLALSWFYEQYADDAAVISKTLELEQTILNLID